MNLLVVWITAAIAFAGGWIVAVMMTRHHGAPPPIDTEEQREANQRVYNIPPPPLSRATLAKDYKPAAEWNTDYIDRVKCPNTGIDTRYCTCLTCDAAHTD